MNEPADPIQTVPERMEKTHLPAANVATPSYIGRYRVECLMGQGGFGHVFLAHDDQLNRPVAVKVPHRGLVARSLDAEAYLSEARIVAQLDHPHIVPVFDVGSTEEYPFFSVSKFIEGCTLAQKLKAGKSSPRAAAHMVATVAEALHYAHRKGVVHRDVKPGNILLDANETPFVVDFGLALREGEMGHGSRYAGTPAYMSPEQARGEGHRVDGRSDIFSLGVVLYELLTGRRPFESAAHTDLLELITDFEPRPPRQYDDSIPKELERICQKAMSKRVIDRYSTAKDLADDLHQYLAEPTVDQPGVLLDETPSSASACATPNSFGNTPTKVVAPTSNSRPLKIVPKGLRSFDAHDADFFLELLPGARDRDGLPDSIRFWKNRIEETDPGNAFAVGMIYGPSGCGKSSLVKAGLLPRLATLIVPIYVEATPDKTETRLLSGLLKHCPRLADHHGLKELLAAVRRGQGLAAGKKMLIILDQFEQWLHSKGGEPNPELVQALRQCDGGRVQCLVLVRDDFWMAATRFMRELEIRLLEGHNSAAVDLFPIRHAERVLTAFGVSAGSLPENSSATSKDQKQFVQRAVQGLAQDGKVISVRLAIFAEMMKGKSWSVTTLRKVGGPEGVGVTFLEETFSAATAPPEHRYHQRAARAVLQTLLPDAGTDLKGHMRSQQELLKASGYADRPEDFAHLLGILDGELRLLTPTDADGLDEDAFRKATCLARSPARSTEGVCDPCALYYQLTHDYLVPAIRDWLTRKQRETLRGRLSLRLVDRATLWNSRPGTRYLPSWAEWACIRLLTRRREWSPPARKMMRATDRYHVARLAGVVAFLLVLGVTAREYLGRLETRALRARLVTAAPEEVPEILKEIDARRRWDDPLLREGDGQVTDPKARLHLSLARLPSDPTQIGYLYDRLFDVPLQELILVRSRLSLHKEALSQRLWAELANCGSEPDRRFRAACVLAAYAPEAAAWAEFAPFLVDRLASDETLAQSHWESALEPAGPRFLPAIADFLAEDRWEAAQRRRAIELYGYFARGQTNAFTPLTERFFNAHGQQHCGPRRLRGKANIAAALIVLGRGDGLWQLLVHTPDPTLRSYLIDRLGSSGIRASVLEKRFNEEQDISARRALLLVLGAAQVSRSPKLEEELLAQYENQPDSGLHAAAGCVLQQWQQRDSLRQVDERLATGRVEGDRHWYVNKARQTFVILSTPARSGQSRANSSVGGMRRRFALAATEVTVEQFLAFKPDHPYDHDISPTPDCPMNSVSWYDAAGYCNWLSARDGIPEKEWCYQRDQSGLLDFVPDWQGRTGYRLPSDEEWIFACRAGAQTPWAFGEADETLVGQYAWWLGNAHANGVSRSFPVASLKPNDWGLFDMHGNVAEWCQEAPPQQLKFLDDVTAGGRGGCYYSAYRTVAWDKPFVGRRKMAAKNIGFRPARTLP